MRANLWSYLTGVIFGVGLILAGMVDPAKVIGFLDLFGGAWDPSLAFVMGGAVAVHFIAFRVITKRHSPLFDASFHLPTRTDIDPKLIGGAALFGIGWGLAGFCPGPGLTSLGTGSAAAVFVAAMLLGMWLQHQTASSAARAGSNLVALFLVAGTFVGCDERGVSGAEVDLVDHDLLSEVEVLDADGDELDASSPVDTDEDTAWRGPAVRSADDFAGNDAGVVTAGTVRRWIALAEATSESTPPERGLVILQLGPAGEAGRFLPSLDGVRTFDATNLPRLLQERSNGLTASQLAPGRGARVDSFLRNFGIDLRRDRILLAAGDTSPTALADLARAWLTFRYWGIAHESLAILDGTVADGFEPEELAFDPLVPPVDGTFRVPRLPTANFSLLAYPEDVRATVDAGTPILDVRPRDEFDGIVLSTSAHDATCLAGAPACTALFGGRIAGAIHLPLEALADTTRVRWSPPGEVDLALAGVIGERVGALVYDADGATSAIAAVSLLAVAGRPARWYAGSFVEWSALSASHPEAALRAVPVDSPWRTDLGLVEAIGAYAEVELGVRPLVLDPNVQSTSRIAEEDARYRAQPPELPAAGIGDANCTP